MSGAAGKWAWLTDYEGGRGDEAGVGRSILLAFLLPVTPLPLLKASEVVYSHHNMPRTLFSCSVMYTTRFTTTGSRHVVIGIRCHARPAWGWVGFGHWVRCPSEPFICKWHQHLISTTTVATSYKPHSMHT